MYTKYTLEFTEGHETLKFGNPMEPGTPEAGDQVPFNLWKLDLKEFQMKTQEYLNFWTGLYNPVLGQCTSSIHERLKLHGDFQAANLDGIALLIIIRSLIHKKERSRLCDSLTDAKESFYKFYQGKYRKLEEYHKLFLAQVELLE